MNEQQSIEKKVARIAQVLTEKQCTLSLAESCTGGLLGHLITEFPGASSFFLGSIVSYHNDAKMNLLSVSGQALNSAGAVSSMVVRQMASGARKEFGSDYALSISGIAGPGGGSIDKPVGTVFIGWAEETSIQSWSFLLTGNRSRIKTRAAAKALEIILEKIDN